MNAVLDQLSRAQPCAAPDALAQGYRGTWLVVLQGTLNLIEGKRIVGHEPSGTQWVTFWDGPLTGVAEALRLVVACGYRARVYGDGVGVFDSEEET